MYINHRVQFKNKMVYVNVYKPQIILRRPLTLLLETEGSGIKFYITQEKKNLFLIFESNLVVHGNF